MEQGPHVGEVEAVEMQPVGGGQPGSLRPNPFALHQDGNGDVRILIQNRDGQIQDGVLNLVGDPQATLTSYGKLPFSGIIEKLVTQFGLDSLKIYLRLIKNLVQARQKGVANTVQTALQLPLTIGCSVLGGFLPTSWIAPNLGTNIQNAIGTILPFLGTNVTYGLAIFVSVSVCTKWGHQFTDKIMSYIFSYLLDTPDSLLYFTEAEMTQVLNQIQNGQAIPADLQKKFEDAISFLKGMAAQEQNSFQDFASLRYDREVTHVAEKLRTGNFRSLLKYAGTVKEANRVALSSATRSTADNADLRRQTEMFLAEKVIQDFQHRL